MSEAIFFVFFLSLYFWHYKLSEGLDHKKPQMALKQLILSFFDAKKGGVSHDSFMTIMGVGDSTLAILITPEETAASALFYIKPLIDTV